MTRVHLTERALADIGEIERYSIEQWGPRVADRYLDDLNEALNRLAESPGLLCARPEYSGRLRFYAVREHVLVCDAIGSRVFVLTVWHGAMDFVGRLDAIEPQLVLEAELLARRIESARGS
jgi:toxin ParE1/3/4